MSAAKKSINAMLKSEKTDLANGKLMDKQKTSELDTLDQIREMLFGEQVAALHEKCQFLDSNLEKNISALRTEMKSSIDELKTYIEKNIDQLQKRINSEETEREGLDERLSTSLTNIHSDISTMIDLEAKRIDEVIEQHHQEYVHQLGKVTESLVSKLDRKSLAQLFNQFADNLEGS